jgi:alpha-galactosidase
MTGALYMRRSIRTFSLSLLLALLGRTPAQAASTVAAQNGDASIEHDSATGTWTIKAGGAALTLALDSTRDFAVLGLISPSGKPWTLGAASDSFVRVGSRTFPFGSRSAGFAYDSATVEAHDNTIQLNAAFTLADLTITRHYAVVPGSPSFEAWTTYAAQSATAVADLYVLQLTVPAGAIHSVTGLQGDAAGDPDGAIDSAFTLQDTSLAAGGHLALGAAKRASEQTVPWVSIDGPPAISSSGAVSVEDEFYAALMWSGAWALTADRTGAGLSIALGLPPMTTTVQAAVNGPHVVFGIARGGMAEGTAALRSYILDGIRNGRPVVPLVTYNTWFAYGTEIDEASMRAEMTRAAALGVELFVVDAGWYANAGADGPYDFDSGLGAWTPDPARFPDGLQPLRDYAHSLGMQFGLWVEPERISLALLEDTGVDERWLAKTGGDYGSDHAAQICLASAAARAWLLDRLGDLLDEVQPDYVKWDNNMFINCDRAGHGHGATDGNFTHVNGLYDLLGALRARYPDLLIENVSGGGNRLDVGMVRYTDAAWMDDRTAPSMHVRHNIEGLSAVFPPAYLLSFVTDHSDGGEPLHDAPDLPLYFRSRMGGALGLCFRSDTITEGDQAAMSGEIAIYKALRGTLSVAAAALLTKQATSGDPPPWDALQESTAAHDRVVIGAFQSDEGARSFIVMPSGLEADVTYQVQSVDAGVLGSATGAELMANGIEVVQSPNSAAHILIVTAQP